MVPPLPDNPLMATTSAPAELVNRDILAWINLSREARQLRGAGKACQDVPRDLRAYDLLRSR